MSQRKQEKSRRLPTKIIPLGCADKTFQETWTQGRDLLNFPHSYRMVLLGPPSSGKSTMMKNILLRADPAFEEVYVVHPDPEFTREWDSFGGVQLLGEIPDPEAWPGEVKTCVILDDLEFRLMGVDQKRALDRLFGYVSSHKNISVMLSAQQCFAITPAIRRLANIFVLWKCVDGDQLMSLQRKINQPLRRLIKLLTQNHDSIMIDNTPHSPAPLRKNGYELISVLR